MNWFQKHLSLKPFFVGWFSELELTSFTYKSRWICSLFLYLYWKGNCVLLYFYQVKEMLW